MSRRSSANTTSVDVAIVGGGMVGHALAGVLAHADGATLRVAVITPDERTSGQSRASRAIALGGGSVAMLAAIGIWPTLAAQAQAMARIIVTDGRPQGTHLSLLEFGEAGSEPSAYVIEEQPLARALAGSVEGSENVMTVAGRVTAATEDGASVRLGLSSGVDLVAALVVAADGARSVMRSLAGIKTVGWSYRRSGIVATVEHEREHGGVAVERFLPAGPFAILPLHGRRSSLVWTETEDRARSLMQASDTVFARELEVLWQAERGAVTAIGPRACFPLSFHVARRFTKGRIALAGDAAHQVHPLAGQGLNLGLRDAAALAEAVIEAHRLGLDCGARPVLERYERWRRFDTVASALAYDGLNRLFTDERDGVRALRDLGLGLVDRLPLLKRAFMREAAGLSGEIPKLMRGQAI